MNIPVTIGIVTYNASKFILEALESAFNQSYQSLHLIISDDYSKDNTLEVVSKWLVQDRVQHRFISIQILSVPHNTGVSANCNRVIQAAPTEWIKFHAGDDLLLPKCIEENMNYVYQNVDARILFSQVEVYQDTFEPHNYLKTTPHQFPTNLFHLDFDAKKQFQVLCECDRIHYTPSSFFKKSALMDVGLFDESERLVEDYPMWLKLTKAGIRLHYFHKATVGYRIHRNASNNTGNDLIFKPSVINSFKVRQKYAHPYLPWLLVKQETWAYYVTLLFKSLQINKANCVSLFLYRMTTIYLNPFFWMNAIKKRIDLINLP